MAGVLAARLTTFGTLPVVMYADDDAHRFGGDRFLRLIGRAADVMGAVDVRQREQRVAECRRGRSGLAGEDVEPDADAALSRGARERVAVDDFRAGGVDEVRAGRIPSRIDASTKPRVSVVSARWTLTTSDASARRSR